MLMLRDRFTASGLKTPSNQTLLQSFQRAAGAYAAAYDEQTSLALELKQQACNKQPDFLQDSALEEADGKKIRAVLDTMSMDLKSARNSEKENHQLTVELKDKELEIA